MLAESKSEDSYSTHKSFSGKLGTEDYDAHATPTTAARKKPIMSTFKFILPLLPFLAACPINSDNDSDPETDTTNPATDGASATSVTPTDSGDDPTTDDGTTDDPTGDDTTSDDSSTSSTTGDDTTSDESSTGSSGTTSDERSSSTTNGGLDCFSLDQVLSDPQALDAKCEEHPWERLPECNLPLPTCQSVIKMIADYEPCDDIDLCDYILCAEALAVASCGTRPAECDPIIACLEGNTGLLPVDPTKT